MLDLQQRVSSFGRSGGETSRHVASTGSLLRRVRQRHMPHRLPMGRAERRAFLAQVPGADIGDVPAIIAQALALQMAVFLPLRAVGGELLRFLEPRVIVGLDFERAERDGPRASAIACTRIISARARHDPLHLAADILHPQRGIAELLAMAVRRRTHDGQLGTAQGHAARTAVRRRATALDD